MEDTVVVHKPTIKMATVMKKVQALECQAVVLVVVGVLTEQDLLAVAVEIDVSSLIAMDKNLIEAVISQKHTGIKNPVQITPVAVRATLKAVRAEASHLAPVVAAAVRKAAGMRMSAGLLLCQMLLRQTEVQHSV